MQHEFQALLKNDTWRLVAPPSGVNIIDSKWVFKVKKHMPMALLSSTRHG
jgi:hypothetical protein